MGITTLNKLIGTDEFKTQSFISVDETNACLENCAKIEEQCGTVINLFSKLLNLLGFSSAITQCPLTYYNCTTNINIKDKLLSGYYSGQTLTDGVSSFSILKNCFKIN